MRSFMVLPDLRRTFCPQAIGVRDPQYRTRFLPIQHEVCLPEQAPDVGARVMTRHGSIRVAEERLAILHRHAHGA
jgi:hypothetical protein